MYFFIYFFCSCLLVFESFTPEMVSVEKCDCQLKTNVFCCCCFSCYVRPGLVIFFLISAKTYI